MRSHLLAFDDLVRQLKMAGVQDEDLVSKLCLSLLDSYDHLVTALEIINEADLNLDLVKQRLLAEELKRADRQGETVEGQTGGVCGPPMKQEWW